jgi:hypothetical protein
MKFSHASPSTIAYHVPCKRPPPTSPYRGIFVDINGLPLLIQQLMLFPESQLKSEVMSATDLWWLLGTDTGKREGESSFESQPDRDVRVIRTTC